MQVRVKEGLGRADIRGHWALMGNEHQGLSKMLQLDLEMKTVVALCLGSRLITKSISISGRKAGEWQRPVFVGQCSGELLKT